MSAASFINSFSLQAITAVMLWPVHVQKVPQVSEHLCPAKLLSGCDIRCAGQSICRIRLFYQTDADTFPRAAVTVAARRGCHSSFFLGLGLVTLVMFMSLAQYLVALSTT